MTVATSTSKVIYTGNGSTTQWDIPFPFLSAQDIELYRINRQGLSTKITSDYQINTVSHVLTYPLQNNGVGPLPSGEKLLILRTTPLKQETSFSAEQTLDPAVLENGYDKAMLISQELAEKISRCVQFPIGYTGENTDGQSYSEQIQAVLDEIVEVEDEMEHLQESIALAKDWATKTSGTVDDNEYSAKYYAQATSQAAASKAEYDLSNLTATGKEKIAHLALPSETYVELTLGATGSTYTMPEDGYVVLQANGGTVGGYVALASGKFNIVQVASQTYELLTGWLPVQKGCVFTVSYGNSGTIPVFGYVKAQAIA